MTPLHTCARKGNLKVFKCLIDHCEVQNPTSNTLTTPLHIAAKYSNLEILQYLVDIGVKLDIQDIDGWTPLHLSAMAKVQYWPGL